MKNKIKNTTRRSFIQGATAGTALAAAGISGFPHVVRAADPVKVGVIHPVTGWAQYSGSQCRFGALAAIEEVKCGYEREGYVIRNDGRRERGGGAVG